MFQRIICVLILVLLCTKATLLAQNDISFEAYMQERDSLVQLNIGKQYQSFTASHLYENKTVTEKDLQGKVTIINFWFQECAPCVAEFGALNKLYTSFRSKPAFQFISFTNDLKMNAIKSVKRYDLLFPIYPISPDECNRLIYDQGYPTTIIVNDLGKVVLIKSGGSLDQAEIDATVHKYAQIIDSLLLATNRTTVTPKNGISTDTTILARQEQLHAIDSVYTQESNKPFPDFVLDSTWLIALGTNTKISLREMLNRYDQKMIYLDVWASWCGGCRKDIRESKMAKQFLDEQDAPWIYLSCDEDTNAWATAAIKDSITSNQYRLLDTQNSPLLNYLNVTLIPRYLVLDLEHHLVSTYGPRPTNMIELEKLFKK